MPIVTMTSRQFNQDTAGAKKAAQQGPVFITDRGRAAHVLLTIEDYHRLRGEETSLLAALAHPASADIDFEPEPIATPLHRVPEF
ncbi:prevent-host-death family protein [Fulvimarina manganoxydans]|uniref:Prevent-host-death family protein n=1 Tax=Fulvimarina manganoxydans TaxID=937218 RepID=A0A1W2C1S9_9HYPH|nr:type II toxin-antitoxin system Phd/YefM family antitoxin [Fulvimarina manganoxydans]MCK5934076.1 type II toxin-antitoxin system Phd/YefM family antitoxin [Fulvimarina manganoxydans]SMC78964.1 prevent-host-death family protein [Fulvimarina manganoxydans]